nr:10513_t:CDS:2 [Entrophospora candida]
MAAALGYPSVSCMYCKSKKVECDKLIPFCTACTESNNNCQYTSYSLSQPLIYDENKFINTSINCNVNVNDNSINNNEHFLNNKSQLEQSHQRIPSKFHPYCFDAKYVEFSEPTCSPYELFNSRKQNDDNLEDFNSNRNTNYNQLLLDNSPLLSLPYMHSPSTTFNNKIPSPISDNNCCLDSPPQTLQQPQLLQSPLQTNTSMTAPEIQITPDDGNDRDNISTTANLSNGQVITIYVPDLEYAQIILENNTSTNLPAPQELFYFALLDEIRQIPNFNITNAELAKVFTNSWRNSSIEYTDKFIILADKLELD